MKHYKFLDLADVNAPMSSTIKKAMASVVDSGRYIGGPEVELFEHRLASMHGLDADCAVGVSNGLDALRLILRAYIQLGRLSVGDEVIAPANTYIASVLAITDSGLRPVFVDPDSDTFNISGETILPAIGPKTKAIMPVHLYGRPAWDEAMAQLITERGMIVVEDNAQAIGAEAETAGLFGSRRTGTLGHAAAFSFYPTKNIGALGDAGAVISRDRELTDAVRALRNYGSAKRYQNIYAGLNCRLDAVQAAILSAKLPYLEAETTRRRQLAAIYLSKITNPAVTLPTECSGSVWHQFVVRTAGRDRFRMFLSEHGVETDIHYPLPPYLQPCYRDVYSGLHLPVSRQMAETVVSLPISASTSLTDAGEIAEIINTYSE